MGGDLQGAQILEVELGSAIFLEEGGGLRVGEMLEGAAYLVVFEESVGQAATRCLRVHNGAAREVDVVLRVTGPISTDVQIHGVFYSNNDQ